MFLTFSYSSISNIYSIRYNLNPALWLLMIISYLNPLFSSFWTNIINFEVLRWTLYLSLKIKLYLSLKIFEA